MLDQIKTILLDLLKNSGITLAKLGTLLIDRRVWEYVAVVLVALFGLPWIADNTLQFSTDMAHAMELFIQGITLVAGLIKLIDSHTVRPPSGTAYKASAEKAALIKFLKDSGIDL